jgi:hypothetical protein
MKVNVKKPKEMVICTCNKDKDIEINGENLVKVIVSYKYLGIEFDCSCN